MRDCKKMSYEAGDRQNESERERKTTLESGRQKSERGREREPEQYRWNRAGGVRALAR